MDAPVTRVEDLGRRLAHLRVVVDDQDIAAVICIGHRHSLDTMGRTSANPSGPVVGARPSGPVVGAASCGRAVLAVPAPHQAS